MSATARSHTHIFKVSIDTADLNCWLAKRYFGESLSKPAQKCEDVELNVPFALQKLTEAEKWYLLGSIYSEFDPREAIEMFKNALSATLPREQFLAGTCLLYLARQYEALMHSSGENSQQRKDCFMYALILNEMALEIFEEGASRKHLLEKARLLNNIGMLYRAIPERSFIEKAMECLKRALSIDLELQDIEGQARTYNNMGTTEYAMGNLSEAIKNTNIAIAIDRKIGDLKVLAVHLGNLGKYYSDNGDMRSLNAIMESIEIGKQLGGIDMVANGLNTLGYHYSSRGESKTSEKYYAEAYDVALKGNPYLANIIKQNLDLIRLRLQ